MSRKDSSFHTFDRFLPDSLLSISPAPPVPVKPTVVPVVVVCVIPEESPTEGAPGTLGPNPNNSDNPPAISGRASASVVGEIGRLGISVTVLGS